jgi:hypothetical protein
MQRNYIDTYAIGKAGKWGSLYQYSNLMWKSHMLKMKALYSYLIDFFSQHSMTLVHSIEVVKMLYLSITIKKRVKKNKC